MDSDHSLGGINGFGKKRMEKRKISVLSKWTLSYKLRVHVARLAHEMFGMHNELYGTSKGKMINIATNDIATPENCLSLIMTNEIGMSLPFTAFFFLIFLNLCFDHVYVVFLKSCDVSWNPKSWKRVLFTCLNLQIWDSYWFALIYLSFFYQIIPYIVLNQTE